MANKPNSKSEVGGLEEESQSSSEVERETVIGKVDDDKHFGVRPSSSFQRTPKAKGEKLREFEEFLVQLKVRSLPPKQPGLQSEIILEGAKVMDKVRGPKKIEPELIYGTRARRNVSQLGLNEQFIFESRTPIRLWFPKGSVQENDNIRAKKENILIMDGGFAQWIPFYFFEWKGGLKIEEQIEAKKKEYEYQSPNT